MLITPEPELDFLAAIKIAVSSKEKHWQLPKKAYYKKNGYIFIENFNNHHYYHSQRLPLRENAFIVTLLAVSFDRYEASYLVETELPSCIQVWSSGRNAIMFIHCNKQLVRELSSCFRPTTAVHMQHIRLGSHA